MSWRAAESRWNPQAADPPGHQGRDGRPLRIIDGKKYLLIRAEEGVEVNGVAIAITDPEESPF